LAQVFGSQQLCVSPTAIGPAPSIHQPIPKTVASRENIEMGDPEQVKAVFAKYDQNGDGLIQLEELTQVMTTLGKMSAADAKKLFSAMDKDHSGSLDYKEFVDWIFKAPKSEAKAKAILASGGAMTLERLFFNFCGSSSDLDGKSWSKLCKDCGLFNKKYTATDADLVFAKVCPKGQRRITFDQFKRLLGLVGEKLECSADQVEDKIMTSKGAGGPVLAGTQADAVRFHDDKSTYTGAHARDGRHDTGAAPPLDEPVDIDKKVAETAAAAPVAAKVKDAPAAAPAEKSQPTALDKVFKNYCGTSHDLDGKGFAKLCKDSGLYNKKYTSTDADLIFAKVCPKGQRRIIFHDFENALKLVAEKLGKDVGEVEDQIMTSGGGPVLKGTEADAVRFHDDKSTYTGAHVGK